MLLAENHLFFFLVVMRVHQSRNHEEDSEREVCETMYNMYENILWHYWLQKAKDVLREDKIIKKKLKHKAAWAMF